MDASNICAYDPPKRFQWNSFLGQNWMTPVRDQAGCGSCWAFASVGAIEGKYKIEQGSSFARLDLSEQDLVSCSHAGSCMGGWHSTALDYIKNTGIVEESCLSYQSRNCTYNKATGKLSKVSDSSEDDKKEGWNPACYSQCDSGSRCSLPQTCEKCSGGRTWKIDRYQKVSSDRNSIKRALMCEGPLSVSSENWHHVVVLVGWDDYKGEWIIRNSWGSWWEKDGYGREPYDGVHSDLVNDVLSVNGVR